MSPATAVGMSVDVGEPELDHVKLFDIDGDSVTVESIWRGRTTLFVFLRHYG